MSKKIRIIVLALVAFLMLACSVTATTPAPGTNETQVAMQVQLTLQAGQQATMGAQLTQQSGQPPSQPTPIPPQVQPTNPPPQPTALPPAQPTATQDLKAQMASAKILVYEDAASADLGMWVKDTLNMMGLNYKHDNDALGDFMEDLNSGTRWDLIIIAGESRSGVQGEFWDIITPKVVSNKTALIVEMWYLSDTHLGRIQPLITQCGIEYQSTRSDVDSIYTLAPDNPVFSTPNSGVSLIHYNTYWYDKGGDYVRLTPGSNAILLAGRSINEKSSYGLLTSCFDGRVIFQTFSTHDYNRSVMQLLWQNYITYVLTNHFAAQP